MGLGLSDLDTDLYEVFETGDYECLKSVGELVFLLLTIKGKNIYN